MFFWIPLMIAFAVFVLYLCVVHSEEFFPLIFVEIIILLISAGVSGNYDKEEVVYHYYEKIGTENTQMIGKLEYMYTKHNGDHKVNRIEDVIIKDIQGDYYIDYKYIKMYNDSFFKYKNEDYKEVIELVQK